MTVTHDFRSAALPPSYKDMAGTNSHWNFIPSTPKTSRWAGSSREVALTDGKLNPWGVQNLKSERGTGGLQNCSQANLNCQQGTPKLGCLRKSPSYTWSKAFNLCTLPFSYYMILLQLSHSQFRVAIFCIQSLTKDHRKNMSVSL